MVNFSYPYKESSVVLPIPSEGLTISWEVFTNSDEWFIQCIHTDVINVFIELIARANIPADK